MRDKFISPVMRQLQQQAQAMEQLKQSVDQLSAGTLSNGELSVSLINSKERQFFWVSYAGASDGISATAHRADACFPGELTELCKEKDKYFLDIGANIGAISLYLAACGWKGACIEASQKNCAVLRKSIELNEFELSLFEVGIWEQPGKIYFHQLGPYGYISLEPVEGAEPIQVTSLDDLQEDLQNSLPRLDFIKMDIEGSEIAALSGGGIF